MHKFPSDLAQVIIDKLPVKSIKGLTLKLLTQLLETAFFTSLHTEEGEPVLCTLTYINPENPDPYPPDEATPDRWGSVSFKRLIPLTVANLVKLAKAASQTSSNIAIYHDVRGKLFIWGMLDQARRYADYINLEVDVGGEVPGYFNVAINGVGSLSVYKDYTLIGGMRQHEIVSRGFNVLQFGPVAKLLRQGIDTYMERVRTVVGADAFDRQRDHWEESLSWYWLSSLRRVLIAAQGYRHGGSILLIPKSPGQYARQLDIKYKITYDRLPTALVGLATAAIQSSNADARITDDFLLTERKTIPTPLFQASHDERIEEERRASEITGCVRFISSLSRVDGVVLLDFDFRVRGFGVEIKSTEDLDDVYIAGDIAGAPKHLTTIDYKQFGTRHRSMMRFCSENPGALGFVISQDGEIRAMTQVGTRLVIWENIELKLG